MDTFPIHATSQFVLSWLRALEMSYLDYTVQVCFFLVLFLRMYQQGPRMYSKLARMLRESPCAVFSFLNIWDEIKHKTVC